MKNRIGMIGVFLGLVSLTLAFTSPWIAKQLAPPKSTEESVVDFAMKIKDVVEARAKGEQYESEPEEKTLADHVPLGIICLSMVSTSLGVISLVREEKRIVGSTAALLGISAAIVQWSILIACAVVFALLVGIVLSALGIDIG